MNTTKLLNTSDNSPKLLPFITKSSIAILFTIGLFSVWQSGNSLIRAWKNLLPALTNEVDVSSLVVQKIQGVSELTTTVFTMDAVVPTSSTRTMGPWKIGETNLLYLARGEVRAGLDLSEITTGNILVTDDGIKIRLPEPQILDSKIDVNNSQVYHYDRGFLSLGPDVAPDLQTEAQKITLAKVVDSACGQGILTQANERAVLTVSQLMKSAGHENVEVITTKPTQCG